MKKVILLTVISLISLFFPFYAYSQQEIYDECNAMLLQGKINESLEKAKLMLHSDYSEYGELWYNLFMSTYYGLNQEPSKCEECLSLITSVVEKPNTLERNFLVYYHYTMIFFYSTHSPNDTRSASKIIDSCNRIEELLNGELEDLSLSMLLTYKGAGYYQLGMFNDAKAILIRAIETIDSSSQFQDSFYYYCSQNLSDIYYKEGDHEKAKDVLVRTISRCAKENCDQILISDLCRDLASMYEADSDFDNYVKYQKLSSSFLENYTLSHKRNDRFDFDALGTEVHAAINFQQAGNFAKCIDQCLYILNEFSDDLSKDHLNAARCYMMLGNCYCNLSDYDNAELFFNQSINQLGALPDHDDYWKNSVRRIGEFYQRLNNHEMAQIYFNIVKDEFEKELNFGNNYAECLCDLAHSKLALDEDLIAKIYIDTAYRILKDSDADPEWVANAMMTAINFYEIAGYNEDAIRTSKDAVQYAKQRCREDVQQHTSIYLANSLLKSDLITEAYETVKGLNEEFRSYPEALYIRYLNGDETVATDATNRSNAIINDVTRVFSHLSYDEREKYWSKYSYHLTNYNTYIFNLKDKSKYGQIYNNAIFSKGLLLRSTTKLRDIIYSSSDQTAIALYDEMIELQRSLSENEIPSDSSANIKTIIDKYEKELRRRISSYDNVVLSESYDWTSIKKALKKNEAAIEFIQLFDYVKNYTVYGAYAAIVIKCNSTYPEIIELCKDNTLQSCEDDDFDTLYSLLWKSIEPYLKDVKTIYYSPIGNLNNISFAALHADNGYLCDRFTLHQLTTTQNLCEKTTLSKRDVADILLYGGIKFDTDSTSMMTNASVYNYDHKNYYALSRSNEDMQSGFDELPHTLYEVESINEIMKRSGISSDVLKSDLANEESFKSLSHHSPSIIHVATHGFSVTKRTITNDYIQSLSRSQMDNTSFVMTQSGLVLSGGNNAWKNNIKFPGCEDGLLTSQEISSIDLQKTKLAVLSACDTGGGHISSEGVFGLQRAFKLAGVKTLIVSLRPVDDKVTSLLMIKFYNYLIKGEEVHSAFYHAMLDIRIEYSDPAHWSSFIILD